MAEMPWIMKYCATAEERDAVIAARDFCRAQHMPGYPALDRVADRWKSAIEPTGSTKEPTDG